MSKTKSKLSKLAIATMIGLGAVAAQAQNINGDINGTVLPGCTIMNTQNLVFNMNMNVGRVGLAQADISIICSTNLPYNIRAESTMRSYLSSSNETVNVRAYSDSARTTQITTTAGITALGNSTLATHTIYLKAESIIGPDLGQGRVLTRDGTFTGTFNFILSF